MFKVFYTVKIVYICVFMTSSTSYCLCDTFTDPWNLCIYALCVMCITWHSSHYPQCPHSAVWNELWHPTFCWL